tara:strand:- start:373 stop:6471 length:6099 start_codon:yes stop_codon:yes gene_type:complete
MDTSKIPDEINKAQSNVSITIELGDIIELISPANDIMHESTMFIKYIDNNHIQLIQVSTLKEYQLSIDENGFITDESIIQINLLSRSDEKGYVRQNNLLPNTWINIHIGGEIPAIITGEITNIEEDMLEMITYPELKTIFIDFKYQGIPLNIPIEQIIIREKPISLKNIKSLSLIKQGLEDGEDYDFPDEEFASIQFTESGDSIINIPEGKTEQNIHDTLNELYLDANSINGDELGDIAQVVERPENEQQYGVDIQVNDMMDELLSTIPNTERTKKVMDNIHNLIEKYKLLRKQFSKFDNNQNIYDIQRYGDYYKPLIQNILKMNTRLNWLLPVVRLNKKIYSNSTEFTDVINEDTRATLTEIESLQNSYYDQNSRDDLRDYIVMQRRIQDIMNPMISNNEDSMYSTQVLTDIEAIVDNLDDFNSTVYTKAGLSKRQYVIQRYNLGLTRLDNTLLKNGKSIYTRTNMTPNDMISLKSLVTLPYPVIRFSSINLSTTSILDRASLHNHYFLLFRALRKNTDITPHVINNFEKELDHENLDENTKKTILDGMHEFILDDSNSENNNNNFEKFLECIIPTTRIFIRIFRKHIKNKLTMVSVVKELEPFMIYSDNITYAHYKEIRFHIKEQIKELKQKMNTKYNEFSKIKRQKYNIVKTPNVLLKILNDKTDIIDNLFQIYKINNKDNTNITTTEMLHHMLNTDNCTLYMNTITTILISLMTPTNLLSILNEPALDDMTDVEKIKPMDCTKRYLSKKYTSIKELQKDNDVEHIFVDEEYDDTPYNLLDNYSNEQQKLDPNIFVDFLTENLIQKHDYPKHLANDMAKIIIAKKKEITNGNYAILEIKPSLKPGIDESKLNDSDKESIDMEADIRKKIQYYKRLKNNWIVDDEMEENSFKDTNDIFCNISEECFYNKKNKICDSNDLNKIRIRDQNKDNLINEFDKRYHRSVDEIEKELEEKIAFHIKLLKRNNMIRDVREYKYNNLAYEIGKTSDKKEIIKSPHIPLRNLIMGNDEFSNKQTEICRFVDQHCREPMIEQMNESPNWLYCKDTNTPLFPVSIFKLANTFISGGDYKHKLDEICNEYGIISDDGDSIVDKYSGEFLRKLDFSDEDGYDEAGFRITTHDIIEKDLGITMMSNIANTSKVFNDELTETIYNIAKTLTKNMHISLDSIQDFIIQISNELITKHIITESSYKIRSETAMKKKGKPLGPYANYRNETVILIVTSVLFVSIQTAIPSFTVNKTFPGCVKSITGYPFTGIEDISGIKYIACILYKSKSSITPWNSLQKLNAEKITMRLKEVIENYIMKKPEFEELYTKKHQYLILKPDSVIPNEHNITKWHNFMPPVISFSIIKSLRPIGGDFKNELLETIKKGSLSQNNMISLLNSRISFFGYGLIELINDIVKTENLLLKTSSEIPFLENACCNENTDLTKPLSYFNDKNANIRVLIQKVRSMIKLQYYIKDISKSPIIYHPESTRLVHPDLPDGRLEENIYAAVFSYCNFDRKLPVPDNLSFICNEKPDNYKSTWSLLEKIEFMKRNGKHYDVDSLNNLMKVINEQNLISINYDDDVNIINNIVELLDHLDNSDSTLFDTRFREHLRLVLNQYNPKQMRDTYTKEMDDFTDYLTTCNQSMYRKIMVFFDEHGNLTDNEYTHLNQFISQLHVWNVDSKANTTENISDNGLYTISQFIQNSIVMITKVYPKILINNSKFFNKVPVHWDLAKDHIVDVNKFINKYYESLDAFRNDNPLIEVLQEVENQMTDMILFIKNIPIQTDIKREIIDENGVKRVISFYSLFNKDTIHLLFNYCFYLTLCNYINICDKANIIQIDIENNKKIRRNQNTNLQDTALNMQAFSNNDENQDHITEVQIYTDNANIHLKSRVASLLYTFLQIDIANKKEINYSYDGIMRKVNLAKEREKKGFVDYLGNMSIENRKAEDLMKKYRLGKWNVGQQTGIFKYNKETYTRERSEMMEQLTEDVMGNMHNVVNEMRTSVYDLELQEEEDMNNQEQQETNIQNMNEDYMDGVVYEEDQDDDFD